jgi:hypothetical protein
LTTSWAQDTVLFTAVSRSELAMPHFNTLDTNALWAVDADVAFVLP